MPSTVFAVPILPGKTEARKSAIAEMTGPRKNKCIEARRAIGITKEVVCLQQTPHGDSVCVYLEAANVSHILQDMVQATDAFHRWFVEAVIKDAHGMDPSHSLPPANEVYSDLI
jgi:hypothetical protein